ncbi:hypothetical protein [Vibrio gallaecicus]|nr:hypothetical protein [Vibrio gallaecicus]MDN3617337.1 hypothetical protein [Vibrio gallaecicus]
MAFCILSWVKCLRCNGLGWVVGVAHYLTWRYVVEKGLAYAWS